MTPALNAQKSAQAQNFLKSNFFRRKNYKESIIISKVKPHGIYKFSLVNFISKFQNKWELKVSNISGKSEIQGCKTVNKRIKCYKFETVKM